MNLTIFTIIRYFFYTVALITIASMGIVMLQDEKEQKELEGTLKKKDYSEKGGILRKFKVTEDILRILHILLKQKNNEKHTYKVGMSIVITSFLPAVFFLSESQILLGLVTPVFLIYFIRSILIRLETTEEEKIEEQLPGAIDEIVRNANRHDNIQIALDEASRGMEYPIREEIEEMVRRMNVEDNLRVLENFRMKYSSPWIRNFLLILIRLTEDSERRTALSNMQELSEMLEEDQKVKKARVSANRDVVMQIFLFVSIATVAGLGTLAAPQFREYWFQSMGPIMFFIVAWAFIFLSVYLAVNMSITKNKKEGNK